MARKLFRVKATRARSGPLAGGVAFVAYTDAVATVLADISATSGGASLPGSGFTLDALGAATIWGPPDDTSNLYLRVPADPGLGIQEVTADPDARLDALETGGSGHPNLATHDALGLATDAELSTHTAATGAHHTESHAARHAPAAADDLSATYATRAYADAIAQTLDIKESVRAATTADITLSGTQTVDGVALVAGNRVLVKAQTAGETNGLYVVAAGAWSRSADANTSGEVDPGLFAFVEEGTVNADSGWVLITNAPITLGTTVLVFAQFSGSGTVSGGAGLVKTGSVLDVGAGTGIAVAADTVGIAAGGVGGTEIAAAIKDPAAGVAGLRTLGTGGVQAAVGSHTHAGGSTGDVSVTVAASDTPTAIKNNADYICDGTADEAQINQAITDLGAPGGRVQLLPGTFQVNAQIVMASNVTVAGSGRGVTILVMTAGFADATYNGMVKGAGTADATGVALAANATYGDATLTLSSGAGWVAGEWALLRSDLVFEATSSLSARYQGELVQVGSVAGAVLTVRGQIRDAYATANAARVHKLTLKSNLGLRDLSIRGASVASHGSSSLDAAAFVRFIYCRQVVVEHLDIANGDGPGVIADQSTGVRVSSCRIADLTDDTANRRYGYGVLAMNAAEQMVVDGCQFTNCRHAFDVGQVGDDGTVLDNSGVARAVVVSNCVADRMSNGVYTTHSEAEGITFTGCVAANTNSTGFYIRGHGIKVIGCTVENCDDGIAVGSNTASATERLGSGSQIIGNVIRRINPDSNGIGITLIRTDHAAVLNNSIELCERAGIYLRNHTNRCVVARNHIFDCNTDASTGATDSAIIFEAAANATGNIIQGNLIGNRAGNLNERGSVGAAKYAIKNTSATATGNYFLDNVAFGMVTGLISDAGSPANTAKGNRHHPQNTADPLDQHPAYAGSITPAMLEASVWAEADADWILTCVINRGGNPQSMNGAVGNYPDNPPIHIRWYQANLACLGLARASEVSGDGQYVAAAWAHLARYQANMGSTPFYVSDKDWNGSAWVTIPLNGNGETFDSTDSYAATALLALRACWRVTGDATTLAAYDTLIANAVVAMRSTQSTVTGLMNATPAYHEALTEDVSEVKAGLEAAIELATVRNLPTTAANAQTYLDALTAGIETYLWQPGSGTYAVGRNSDTGTITAANLATLSPDAMAQAWTVAFGVATGHRAAMLMAKVAAAHPTFDASGTHDATPLAWGFARGDQPARGLVVAATYRARAVASSRAWPYTPMAAGEQIVAETSGVDRIVAAFPAVDPDTAKRGFTLTDGATVTPLAGLTDINRVTLAGNRTLATPAGTPVDGQTLELRVKQDATGSRTLTASAGYTISANLPLTLSTAANATDRLLFTYDSAAAKWWLVELLKGF